MGDSGEYSRGAQTGHRLFMTSLNGGVSLRGLEAMRDRAAQAFSARARSPTEQTFYRGFDDIFGIYLDDLRELEEPSSSPGPASMARAATRSSSGPRTAQALAGHQEMEAGP